MKHLLYIGNQLSQQGKTQTTIDTLSHLLRLELYHVICASKKRNQLFRLLDMLYHVIKYSKQVDYVLIDTYSTLNFQYAFWVSQLCRVLNLKYVPILHGGSLPTRLQNNPKLSRLIFKNAYQNVAPSMYIVSEFKKQGYSNLINIPNTIEIKNYPFQSKTYQSIKLLWVRSFSKIYNPLLAIKILKCLKDADIPATLCMVGPDNDGTLKEAKTYASLLGVDVLFTGKLSKTEWIELSEDYNIFLNTTNFDNMPVSVIEAMALGLLVISTNVGGMPFLVTNNEHGILVPPNSDVEFVKTIKKIRDKPNAANVLTQNARKRAEQFDWDVVKQQWISLLQ
ncbi:glycosyltransferase family 4 protein [Yeosuana marina]|uniref:glycosyltransferase family 4 protein n=1 Tax=Yeosuana marina TaxID=1565536 RepID=UPI0030C8C28C